ncbi:Oligopeptide transporter [Wickerhamomyces ciferrii]|uniref:Oligopeptide transporter n=1 Tax=Wickerhamomyces ciferrii (strain ATCC 14091 / BCRC 22168 / CBS 111 / JCM 3599 / NBRC 0793 / NRRL Y-1031 F-60-10) TaxID=1206466 RepID=K0KQ29_WICCF|nr:Oligopeptide transporter [Wickerhamomyces ciferrii]CCH45151.1 Oligopeptide transporter [Wickerhamomyces ciferrii]
MSDIKELSSSGSDQEKNYDYDPNNKETVLTKHASHDTISIEEHDPNLNAADETYGIPKFDDEKIKEFFETLSDEQIELFLHQTGHGSDLNNDDKDDLTDDLKFILTKIISISDTEALDIFQTTSKNHQRDANFPKLDWDYVQDVLNHNININESPYDQFKTKLLAVLFHYHSPYPEVRSVTDIFNNPDEPVETIRSYTIAMIWLIIGSGVYEFFYHRQPKISLPPAVLSILMYPCGKAWEFIIPNWHINFFGKKIPLNPGPYSYKEQMFASTITNVSYMGVYVTSNIIVQKKFYGHDWVSFGYQVLLALSTQFMGISFAGVLRKFVIYPQRAVWPTILPSLALNRALLKPERREVINGWKISKYKFFWVVFGAMFVYFWLPNYLFTALSIFSWMTWIKPDNFNLAVVTGFQSGLGINPISTFDWSNVINLVNPLAVPFYATANMVIGMFIGTFAILGVYYSNVKWSAYLPPNSVSIFTNQGEEFDVSEIITNGLLDPVKYQDYSPPFYTAGNIVVYSVFFLFYPFGFLFNTYKEWDTVGFALKFIKKDVFELFHNLKNFKSIFSKNTREKRPAAIERYNDPHSRALSKYKEVPDSYYWAILLISLIFGILTVKLYPKTETPVWGIFFAIGINFVFLIPLALLYAVTGVQIGLNVLVELIVGYALPGNGVALMTIKALGYNIDGQADNFISCQKMAHYARIPTRALFRGQIIAIFFQTFTALGVVNWSLSNIKDFCSPHQAQKFTCVEDRIFYSASVLWGVIGPKKVFDGLYPTMKYAFLIGFLLALLFIGIIHFFPKYFPQSFEPQVVINGILNVCPYNLSYGLPPLYFGFIFMYYIKRRYLAWFEKYNYVLSSALNAGVAFGAVIIFFAVQYHAKDVVW